MNRAAGAGPGRERGTVLRVRQMEREERAWYRGFATGWRIAERERDELEAWLEDLLRAAQDDR